MSGSANRCELVPNTFQHPGFQEVRIGAAPFRGAPIGTKPQGAREDHPSASGQQGTGELHRYLCRSLGCRFLTQAGWLCRRHEGLVR